MWTKWLPRRMVVSRVARSSGFIDPISVLSHLHRLAQPSEVTEPVELLRAGMVLHARGLMNTGTIQHNLDWVWPYWVERQFDPHDESFIPRAFSITHVNLTHRNWTAVGLPDCRHMPIVDPRGLVTPLLDGWSLDSWLVTDSGRRLYPSKQKSADQSLQQTDNLAVETIVGDTSFGIESKVDVIHSDDPMCRVQCTGTCDEHAWLVVALRPANPEGVSFIHELEYREPGPRWTVDKQTDVYFSQVPDKVVMSRYRDGDVAEHLLAPAKVTTSNPTTCDVGLVTAAAMFKIEPKRSTTVTVEIPLVHHATWPERLRSFGRQNETPKTSVAHARSNWDEALAGACQIETPNEKWNRLFRSAISSMVLHTPGDVYPGPYTYKRFWFRDAAFVLNGLLAANLPQRVGPIIEKFPERQKRSGYFHSQEGEWDSNGEAIWIIDRYHRATCKKPSVELRNSVLRGADWIVNKRLDDDLDLAHAGLMPAGFSAEHLGPNNYYYWDDFWSVAGLESAAIMARSAGLISDAERLVKEAELLRKAIARSVRQTSKSRYDKNVENGSPSATADESIEPLPPTPVPAAPDRRMDAGAIGSLAGSYPLQIWPPDDPRMQATIDFLVENCLVHGGFFQDMIHSGINPYLTLHIAQVLLRSGADEDQKYVNLVQSVADLASPTGQWPEAVHPKTMGGCMGDGQHMWAAAEWVLMLRNMFVREEGDTLIFGSGLPKRWLQEPCELRFGPTLTDWGPTTVSIVSDGREVTVSWTDDWHSEPAKIEVRLPGLPMATPNEEETSCSVPAFETATP